MQWLAVDLLVMDRSEIDEKIDVENARISTTIRRFGSKGLAKQNTFRRWRTPYQE